MTVEPEELPEPQTAEEDESHSPLLPVEPSYRTVLRVRFALLWIPLAIAALVVDHALSDTIFYGIASIVVPLLGFLIVILAPHRIYRRLGYRLTDKLLQVVRGWMFHTDTIVPFVRVQHIDVTRGPVDKLFGTATLVVHTAGTHNSIVTVPGLAPERAEAVREIIREHVRTDFQ